MNELQRDKIQVNEIRVKDAVPNIIVDILEYSSPKIDYADNELPTAAWVLEQTQAGEVIPEVHTPFTQQGLDTYTAPVGYSVNKARAFVGVYNAAAFNIPRDSMIVGVSEFARQIQVADEGEVGYIVWMP